MLILTSLRKKTNVSVSCGCLISAGSFISTVDIRGKKVKFLIPYVVNVFYFLDMLTFSVFFLTSILIASGSIEIKETQDESIQFDELIKEGHSLAVLFTEECCACTDCVEAEVLLGGMSKDLEENLDLLVIRLKSPKMKKRFGVKRVPTLIYIRENKAAIYDGIFDFETLYEWLQTYKEPVTVDLNDSSFEHLTQAATGATTGDWLVIFHDGSCCKNRELMYLETAGIKLKNKVNVASVDVDKASETTKRFKINTCPEIIFFRHQKLYRFSLPDATAKSLRRFAEGFYKNSKTESVPPPPSVFDKLLDKIFLLFAENLHFLMAALTMTTVSTTLLLIWSVLTRPTHAKSE